MKQTNKREKREKTSISANCGARNSKKTLCKEKFIADNARNRVRLAAFFEFIQMKRETYLRFSLQIGNTFSFFLKSKLILTWWKQHGETGLLRNSNAHFTTFPLYLALLFGMRARFFDALFLFISFVTLNINLALARHGLISFAKFCVLLFTIYGWRFARCYCPFCCCCCHGIRSIPTDKCNIKWYIAKGVH